MPVGWRAPRDHENVLTVHCCGTGILPVMAGASRPGKSSRAGCPCHGGQDARAPIFKAANCRDGDLLAGEQVTANGKEQVLKALGEAATKIREKLGESLPSSSSAPPKPVAGSRGSKTFISVHGAIFLRASILHLHVPGVMLALRQVSIVPCCHAERSEAYPQFVDEFKPQEMEILRLPKIQPHSVESTSLIMLMQLSPEVLKTRAPLCVPLGRFYPGISLHPDSAKLLPVMIPGFGKRPRTTRRENLLARIKLGGRPGGQFAAEGVFFLQVCYRYLPIRLGHLLFPAASYGAPVWAFVNEFGRRLCLKLHHRNCPKIDGQDRNRKCQKDACHHR